MKRVSVLGRGAATVAAAGIVLALVSAVSPASADQIGTLTFNNLTSQDVAFTLTTSGGCPTSPTNATNFQIRITNDTSVAGNTAPTVLGQHHGQYGRWHDRRRHQCRAVHGIRVRTLESSPPTTGSARCCRRAPTRST